MDADLLRRIERIESHQAIQQLPIRYALAVDSRDIDSWVGLFIEDVNCGRHGTGREVLRGMITPAVATFYRSIHQICGHEVTFVDDDHATGRVYCRAEHEDRGQWVAMAICYFDEYERCGRDWFFTRRKERHWYSVDVLTRPGVPFQNWPGHEVQPALPHAFPTWAAYWDKVDPDLVDELTAQR